MIEMISGSRVLRAAELTIGFTFDGDNELGNDWQYFGSSLFEKVVGPQNSEESIWVDLLS